MEYVAYTGLFCFLTYTTVRYVTKRYSGVLDLESLPVNVQIKGEKAIVIGYSWTGILATACLLKHFRKVVIVEADKEHLFDKPMPRKGVLQGAHGHILLDLGYKITEHYLPGFGEKVKNVNGKIIDSGSFVWYALVGWIKKTPTGCVFVCLSRFWLDFTTRGLLISSFGDRITVLYGESVHGLIIDDSTTVGVQLKDFELYGDFVVDCSGKNSRAASWLKEKGVTRATYKPMVTYATMRYKCPPDLGPGYLLMSPLGIPFSLFALRGESDVLIFTTSAYGQKVPLTANSTTAEFDDYVVSIVKVLPIEIQVSLLDFVDKIKGQEIQSSPDLYHPPPFSQLKYTKLPKRFVVLGDALTFMNPLFGEGLTNGAICVTTLDLALWKYDLDSAGQCYMDSIKKKMRLPWLLSRVHDYPMSHTEPVVGESKTGWTIKLTEKIVLAFIPFATKYNFFARLHHRLFLFNWFGKTIGN